MSLSNSVVCVCILKTENAVTAEDCSVMVSSLVCRTVDFNCFVINEQVKSTFHAY